MADAFCQGFAKGWQEILNDSPPKTPPTPSGKGFDEGVAQGRIEAKLEFQIIYCDSILDALKIDLDRVSHEAFMGAIKTYPDDFISKELAEIRDFILCKSDLILQRKKELMDQRISASR